MRTKIDWRSSSKENYNNFCKKNPTIKITFDEWKNIIYQYNEHFKNYILETGEKARLPFGFGEFYINKKKRRKMKGVDGKEFVNLPVDWKKTKQKKLNNNNGKNQTNCTKIHWRKSSSKASRQQGSTKVRCLWRSEETSPI